MSNPPIRHIHLLGFIEEVRHIHTNMPDRRFCFLLGAGASKMSSIPTAGELGLEWLKKIHKERGGIAENFGQWLSEGAHGIDGLPPGTSVADITSFAAAYPAIYQAKWSHDRAQGHAELERHIEAATPSYGYYALAEILNSDSPDSPSRHNVVITPNFDNLPAETLGALGKKIPIVIGHSAIANFARPTLRRPLIIKFHHDFLLGPKSSPTEVDDMDKGYSKALVEIFRLYTPIVIGYGGNDGSLMKLLEELPSESIPGGIQWCWRKGDPPSDRIKAVVAAQAGALIEIPGFDELMALLEEPFGNVFNPDKLCERADLRAQELRKAKERLTEKAEGDISGSSASLELSGGVPSQNVTATASAESSAVLDALNVRVPLSNLTEPEKSGPSAWWHWQKRINVATDAIEKERLYKEGLDAVGNVPQLLSQYAIFLHTQLNDTARAQDYFLRAIAADPTNANYLGNYARFLRALDKDDALIGEFYRKAIAADANHARNLGSYAIFLTEKLNDDVQAEEYFLKAIAVDPSNVTNLGNYALFLEKRRNDDAKAEEYYLRAIGEDPNHAHTLGNYASFLAKRGNDISRAEDFYRKAIAADNGNAATLGRYALFLKKWRNDEVSAEEYFLKAIAAAPDNPDNLINYAQFLIAVARFNDAAVVAAHASALLANEVTMRACELAFSCWLIALVTGKDGLPAIGRLKAILLCSFERTSWSFDDVLGACAPKLTPDQNRLANKLAAAILDASKLVDLDVELDWNKVQPISLDEP
ncbi:hypothetical protein GCM10027277_53200 [Pseudoduganella ginsengisoli]|uniref:Uncharacterized protein n=1 Tax=Pseudoduganella ginsengisoli TaxID=1462440 RepID=A0A6L6Q1L6_9BURK|nr:hypothetical protein [Pseudoduganella ginsengisoli]MTW03314.1 hypothetical protein [Pseudoduganella ginsengisoli]